MLALPRHSWVGTWQHGIPGNAFENRGIKNSPMRYRPCVYSYKEALGPVWGNCPVPFYISKWNRKKLKALRQCTQQESWLSALTRYGRYFYQGATFVNVRNTKHDPPKEAEKDAVHPNRSTCVFCNGDYDGLLHVIPDDPKAKIGSFTTEYYLAPGCQTCNGKVGHLKLKKDAHLIVPRKPKRLEVRRSWVMLRDD